MNNLRNLKIISLCNGLVFYAPVALLLRTSNGISVSEFFLLQVILYGMICILEVPCGFITDKIGYKKSIVLSSIALCIARVQFLYASNFTIFAIEAIIEAISICFISGTMNAYLYEKIDSKTFDISVSKIDNFGTIGFIVSTISFSILYKLIGLTGLVILTIISTFISLIASMQLEETNRIKSNDKFDLSLFKNISFWIYALFNSLMSIGFIVINFFYITKITALKLDIEIISMIILVYSLIQLITPKIIYYLNRINYHYIIPTFVLLAGLFYLVIYFTNNLIISLLLMIVVPTIIMIPYYIISKLQNNYIDNMEMTNNRATILSLFNMGSNIISIVSLLCFSSFSDQSGINAFIIIGIFYIIISIISLLINLENRT